jgi:hypothetical protein
MAIKYLLIGILGLCVGAFSVLICERFSSRHVEIRNAVQPDDSRYAEARRAMIQENPEFYSAFGGDISALKIDGEKTFCYFFYKTSGMIYDGRDIMYCFDKASGAFLGQQ